RRSGRRLDDQRQVLVSLRARPGQTCSPRSAQAARRASARDSRQPWTSTDARRRRTGAGGIIQACLLVPAAVCLPPGRRPFPPPPPRRPGFPRRADARPAGRPGAPRVPPPPRGRSPPPPPPPSGAARAPPARPRRRGGRPESSLVGLGRRTACVTAALVNGT